MRPNFLFFNDRLMYEKRIRGIYVESLLSKKVCKASVVSSHDFFSKRYSNLNRLMNVIEMKKIPRPNAIVRREEHGRYWAQSPEWKTLIQRCYSMDILPMSFDFGYFSHYKTLMVDVYTQDGTSNILSDWSNISEEVDWSKAPEHIQKYRTNFLKILNRCKEEKPINNLKSGEYVVIWMQSFLDLLRPEFKSSEWRDDTEVSDWINKVIEVVLSSGLTPVIKGCPGLWRRFDHSSINNAIIFMDRQHQKEICPTGKFEKNLNAKLIAHAKYHIVSHSSVTNELVLANAPIVAMGQSWFTGLGVFNEPATWDTLLINPMEINIQNRNKWINWWLTRQVDEEKIIPKLIEIYKKYKHE